MVRVLHELANLDGGGVARLLYDYYKYMDHDKIRFDFVISNNFAEGILEKPLRDMGCNIYKLDGLKKNPLHYVKEVDKIIKNGEYDVVHTHIAARGFLILGCAKRHGVKMRIAHSHISHEETGKLKHIFDCFTTYLTIRKTTELYACGEDAGIYRWGKKRSFHVMKNAINTELFSFDENERKKYRDELNLHGKIVYGNVGRLNRQKNHSFLLEVFKEISVRQPEAVLLLVGRGPLEDSIRRQAEELGISSKVIFLGIRSDVPKLLNCMDVFLLPSLYEGLPVALVEAQASGLVSAVSDTVTKEMTVTDLLHFIPLTDSPERWAEEICNFNAVEVNRSMYGELVKKAGYDIQCESKKMQDVYLMGGRKSES